MADVLIEGMGRIFLLEQWFYVTKKGLEKEKLDIMVTFRVIIIMYLIDFIHYFKFISSYMKDLPTKKRSKIILKTKFNTKIKKNFHQ